MSIFEQLGAEWRDGEQHVSDWFSRHARHDAGPGQPGDTIAADGQDCRAAHCPPGPDGICDWPRCATDNDPAITAGHHHQETDMSLATIAADVRAAAETGVTEIRKLLDEHLPQIEELGAIVDANPVFASAQAAAHVPLELLQGVAALLDTMAAAHPKPEDAPAAEVPAEHVVQPA